MTNADSATLGVIIETCDADHMPDWAMLRGELWPDGTVDEHRTFADAAVGEPTRLVAFIARDTERRPLGFAEASLRSDYVNGCTTSPVAFLEGLYVREPYRRSGIARGLVAAIELWGRERGCAELASDALIDNHGSNDTHRAIGFAETERVVFFRKDLDVPFMQ